MFWIKHYGSSPFRLTLFSNSEFLKSYRSLVFQARMPLTLLCTVHGVPVRFCLILTQYGALQSSCNLDNHPACIQACHHSNALLEIYVMIKHNFDCLSLMMRHLLAVLLFSFPIKLDLRLAIFYFRIMYGISPHCRF